MIILHLAKPHPRPVASKLPGLIRNAAELSAYLTRKPLHREAMPGRGKGGKLASLNPV